MRAFIVLCLVAVACADKLGYNYQPVAHSASGLSFTPGSSSGHVSSSYSSSSHGFGVGGSSGGFGAGGSTGGSSHGFGVGGSSHGFGVGGSSGFGVGGGSSGSFGIGGGSSGGFGVGGGSSGGFGGSSGSFGVGGSSGSFGVSGGSHGGFGVGGSGSGAAQGGATHVELEKEFYTFTANEDDFTEPAVENQVVNTAKKGLRVIFIKGPENHALENAAVALAKHAAEQRTAIYVLTKQADVSGLTQKLNTINTNINNKPEVHFVKYRTQEDAINAQKAIQSQYDSLGGTTQNFNGGVAPVLNFASKAPVAAHGGSFGSSGSVGSSGSLGSSGSFGSSGSLGSSGSFGSSGSHGSGSFGSSGSLGSSGSFGSSGSLGSGSFGSSHGSSSSFESSGSLGSSGSFGSSGSSDGSGVSGLSSTYLPASARK